MKLIISFKVQNFIGTALINKKLENKFSDFVLL